MTCTVVVFGNNTTSGIWKILKYYEPVLLPNTTCRSCYYLTLLVNMNFIFSLRSKILRNVLCYMVPFVATTLHMFTEEMRAVSDALFSVLLKCFSVHDNKSLNIHAICNRIIAHCPHLNHEVVIKCNF